MKVKKVEDYIEQHVAPLKLSLPQDINGLVFGTLDMEVTGIAVCWSPTLRVIEASVENKANVILSHEWLVYEQSGSKWMETEKGVYSKIPNLKRIKLLAEHKISVLKHHSNWDIAPQGTADSFGEFLGFKNLVKKGKLIRIYKEKPRMIKELAQGIGEKLDLGCVKVLGNAEKKVKYIGTAVGGLGQIFTFADDFVDTKAEILIFGETLQYGEIYTLESGLPLIVTSHEATEKPGMIKLSKLLRKEFPTINIQYVDSGVRYSFVAAKDK